jgi:hypothetical protein
MGLGKSYMIVSTPMYPQPNQKWNLRHYQQPGYLLLPQSVDMLNEGESESNPKKMGGLTPLFNIIDCHSRFDNL